MSQRLMLSALLIPAVLALPLRADDDLEALKEQATKAALEAMGPSVVQIETTGGSEVISIGRGGIPKPQGVGPTSGVIVAADGYIISSSFNFANKPSAIFIAVPGHKDRYVAKAVARDTTRMLTLLKIDANNLPVPTFVPEQEMRIGQTALA